MPPTLTSHTVNKLSLQDTYVISTFTDFRVAMEANRLLYCAANECGIVTEVVESVGSSSQFLIRSKRVFTCVSIMLC